MNSEQLSQEVRAWLKREKKTTDWLGKQLCVKGGTVRGWCSCRPIPRRYHARLHELMRGSDTASSEAQTYQVPIPTKLVDALRRKAPLDEVEPLMIKHMVEVVSQSISALFKGAAKKNDYPIDDTHDGMEAAEDDE